MTTSFFKKSILPMRRSKKNKRSKGSEMTPPSNLELKRHIQFDVKAVMSYALREVYRRNYEAIDISHLLFAVVRYQWESGGGLFNTLNANATKLYSWVELQLGEGPNLVKISGKIQISSCAHQSLCWALELARRLGESFISSDFVLLALLETNEPIVLSFLAKSGRTLEEARKSLASRYGKDAIFVTPGKSDAKLLVPVEFFTDAIEFDDLGAGFRGHLT